MCSYINTKLNELSGLRGPLSWLKSFKPFDYRAQYLGHI